jgi:hypothetical protein
MIKETDMQYIVILTNFGSVVYQGMDFIAAKEAAIRAGFECTFYAKEEDQEAVFMKWSPISGFHPL